MMQRERLMVLVSLKSGKVLRICTPASHTGDAEICLQKARALKSYSAATLHAEGYMHEAREHSKDALAAYVNAFSMELEYVPSKVAIGALLQARAQVSPRREVLPLGCPEDRADEPDGMALPRESPQARWEGC